MRRVRRRDRTAGCRRGERAVAARQLLLPLPVGRGVRAGRPAGDVPAVGPHRPCAARRDDPARPSGARRHGVVRRGGRRPGSRGRVATQRAGAGQAARDRGAAARPGGASPVRLLDQFRPTSDRVVGLLAPRRPATADVEDLGAATSPRRVRRPLGRRCALAHRPRRRELAGGVATARISSLRSSRQAWTSTPRSSTPAARRSGSSSTPTRRCPRVACSLGPAGSGRKTVGSSPAGEARRCSVTPEFRRSVCRNRPNSRIVSCVEA